MRFSLKWMLGAVAFVGFGCVALFNANEAWAAAALGLTVIVLLVAVVGAIHSNSRAFYTGMAVFGWGYLLLTQPLVRPLAATDVLLNIIYKPLKRVIPDVSREDIPNGAAFVKSGVGFAYQMPIHKHFRAVAHSLFVLVFAIIGGVVGHRFSRGARCDSV